MTSIELKKQGPDWSKALTKWIKFDRLVYPDPNSLWLYLSR